MKKLIALVLLPTFVFALTGCTGRPDETSDTLAGTEGIKNTEKWDLIPMVMVDGILYMDTGYESTMAGRCGVMDGEITSEVDGSERPTINNQSNFGTGYGYQCGEIDGTIEVFMNEAWRIFATEEARQEIQFPTES